MIKKGLFKKCFYFFLQILEKKKHSIQHLLLVVVTGGTDRRRLFKDPIKSSGLFRQLLDWAIRREASMKLLCTLHPTPVSPINDKNIPIQDGRLIVKEIDKHEDKD